MARRSLRVTPLKLLLLLLSLVACSFFYLVFVPLTEPCNCSKDNGQAAINKREDINALEHHAVQPSDDRLQRHLSAERRRELVARGDDPSWGEHKLCIIVPFRDRFEELLDFAPHMHKFLNAQRVRHKLVIVNQGDKLRFNRASLINIGFQQTRDECDYMAMHDVDLLPLNPALNYSYPHLGPWHLAAPDLHPRYHYKTFVGGILLLTREHFTKCDGLSNRFWGWGREDDEFYVRMIEAKLTIRRPHNISTGYDTFKHEHDKVKRPRDYKRYGDQKKNARYRDYKTGLSTVTYESISRHESLIDGAPVTILNVQLDCDFEETSWCIHPEHYAKMEADKKAQQRIKEAAQAEIAVARMQIEESKQRMKQEEEQAQRGQPDDWKL